MAPRVMAAVSSRWLEWGPDDDPRSACRDVSGRFIFTRSEVKLAEGSARGVVSELLARDRVAVVWPSGRVEVFVPEALVVIR